ncbi:MAG: DUF4166 domain-containing protein [Lysinibacillus sp.]
MTIYKSLLGDEFYKLHPKLQCRYLLPIGESFYAEGIMTKIETGAKWLSPFLRATTRLRFLFPESGENIPFTISNTCRPLADGQHEISWERTFFFGDKTRHFDARMTIDLEKQIVKDYLGKPSLFYSDLHFAVTKEGFLLIRSGLQRFVLRKSEFAIPRLLEGRVIVEEGYDDVRDVYTIHVSIHNPLFGRLMMYAGEFTQKFI